MKATDRQRYPNLDLLRLFLALEVVGIHLSARFHTESYILLDPVPTFVCLSGLLIPASFESSRGWAHFAWKRILRVYPAFLVSFALVAALSGPAPLRPTLLTYLTMGAITTGTANGPLWSLLLEEALYTSHVLTRLRRLWRVETVLFLFAACMVGLSLLDPSAWVSQLLRASCAFFAGNLAYFWRDKWQSLSGWWFVAIVTAFRLAKIAGWEGAVTLSPFVCVSAVLAARNLPQIKRNIEDYSYGVYIYHQPIINALLGIGGAAWVVAPAASLAFSAFSWKLIEKPCLKAKDRPPQFAWNRKRARVEALEAA